MPDIPQALYNKLRGLSSELAGHFGETQDKRYANFLRAMVYSLAGIIAAVTALAAASISMIGSSSGASDKELLVSAAFGELLVWLASGILVFTVAALCVQSLRLLQSKTGRTAHKIYPILAAIVGLFALIFGYFIAESGVCAGLAAGQHPDDRPVQMDASVPELLAWAVDCSDEGRRWGLEDTP